MAFTNYIDIKSARPGDWHDDLRLGSPEWPQEPHFGPRLLRLFSGRTERLKSGRVNPDSGFRRAQANGRARMIPVLLLQFGLRVRTSIGWISAVTRSTPCCLLWSGVRFDRADAQLVAIREELEAVNAKSLRSNGLPAPMFAGM